MSDYLLICLITAIMVSPSFCEEVAYVYEDTFMRALDVGNITDYEEDADIGLLKAEIRQKVDVDNQRVKDKANRLALDFPGDREIKQVCAIYDYLAGKWATRSDLRGLEDIQYASYTLLLVEGSNYSGQGDCDDFAVVMAALTERIGGTSRLILAYGDQEGHAYAEVYLGKARESDDNIERIFKWIQWKYNANKIYYHMDENGGVWLNLDWWKESGGAEHPGGPFYEAKNHLPVSIGVSPKEALNPSNLPPTIKKFSSDKPSPLIPGSVVNFEAESSDPEDGKIFYRYYVNGKSKTIWMQNRTVWSWTAEKTDVGSNEIEVRARDGNHASEEGYDDKRSIEFEIAPPPNPLRIKSTASLGDIFTWNPDNFGGFYYDIDKGLGTENLTINCSEGYKLSGQPPYGITYTTKAQNKEFEYSEWGSYKVIGFLAEKYFAGYNPGNNMSSNLFKRESIDYSSLTYQQLEEILEDTNIVVTITSGTPLKLDDGYELGIKSIDIDGKKVYLELNKDGRVVDSKVLTHLRPLTKSDETFEYARDVGNQKNLVTIAVHLKNAFRGADQDLATVDSIWQVSDNDTSQVIINSSDQKIITSGTPLQLGEGYELGIKSIDIGGKKVYLELNKDGRVVDSEVILTRKMPLNKSDEIFVYARDVGNQKNLVTIAVHLKNVFRGADQDLATVDSIWQVSDNDTSQVIINSSDQKIITSGTPLQLGEGYNLSIMSMDIDGDKVYLELEKDGRIVDSKVIIPPKMPLNKSDEIFVYARDVGNQKNLVTIAVHFKNAFRSAGQDLATVDSIWQVSVNDTSQVIINSSDQKILTSRTPLQLGEGYNLSIMSIDIDGDKVYLELEKDGRVVDSKVIIPPKMSLNKSDETFVYARDVGNQKNLVTIAVHFKNASRGADQDYAAIDSIWQVSDNDTSQVIINSSDQKILTSGTPLQLGEGYNLSIVSIDIDGDKVYLELEKDGHVVDSKVIMNPIRADENVGETVDETFEDTFVYSKDVGNQKNLVIIAVHFKNAFRGADQDLATVDGIWQLADYPTDIQVDMEFDGMSVTNVTSDTITLNNKRNPIFLLEEKEYRILNDLWLATTARELTNQDTSPSCSLLKEFFEPGTYIIRGEVATGNFEWNSKNFAAFLCENDPNFGTEKIITKLTEGNKLQEYDGIVYSTTATDKMFQFHPWGSYRAIGYMGHKYFAGYADNPSIDDENEILLKNSKKESTLAYKQLVEILKDDATENVISSGSSLTLAENYELVIKSIEADGKVKIELYKGKDLKDISIIVPSKDGAIMSDQTYYFRSDVGAQQGLVILAVHFKKALRSGDRDMAIIDGVWQISDNPSVELYEDKYYDNMTLSAIDPIKGMIVMNYWDSITLNRNMDIGLVGDIRIRTADNDTLRYYICEEATIAESDISSEALPEIALENAQAFENIAETDATSETIAPENLPSSKQIIRKADESPGIEQGAIWREGISPEEYTWTPQSFSGFFYDLNNDLGTEELTANLSSGRTIKSGDLTYRTRAEDTDFKYGEWGDYKVIGFMAEKYFAGYIASDLIDDDYSFLDEGQLRQVLVDSDDSQTLAGGSTLSLEEGYELQIKKVDIKEDEVKVYLGLAKDGEEIDSKVVSPEGSLESSTYEYEMEVSGEDVPIIMAHIESVFASTESDLVTVDGLFQLSDTYASVEDGDEYGKMEVKSVSQDGVEMSNEDSVNLKEGAEINIFGEVGFIVADDDILRFAPIVDRTGPQEVRGSVIDPSEQEEFTWDVYNFEGFYYDIDEDVGTETLTARITDKKSIEEGDLLYETRPQAVDFEFDRWGKYDVIGFKADKYFAGYNNRTEFTDDFSVIGESELRKVLMDNDDSQTLASGSVLSLEEGYELRVKSVDLNGNKVYLALSRDGEEVDSKEVIPSSDPEDGSSNYLYKVDMGSEDVPIVAVHVESVFRSTESDLATVDGIFQVSDSPESIENGEVHGKMEVKDASEDGITMKNDGSFSLARDKTIEIMENLKFVVADSDKRLFAPVAFKPGEGMNMNVIVPDAVVDAPVTISVKSESAPLAGVQIRLNGSSIGTTDATGSVSYTPSSVGTYQVVAKKKDYNDGKASLVVRTASETASLAAYEQANAILGTQLTINVPADVVKGENFLIAVVQGINQTPVEGAELYLDNFSIGLTGSQGTVTYATNLTGEHMLTAKKEGLNAGSKRNEIVGNLKIEVADSDKKLLAPFATKTSGNT